MVGTPEPADALSPPDPQAAAVGAVSSGARAAGIVFATGYLTGIVPGPIFAVVGGLALITFGRSLLLEARAAAHAALALAVLAVGLGLGGLRWSTLELGDLRGVQAVLGPTVLVGPDTLALATGLAAGACLVGAAVWVSLGPRLDGGDRIWLGLETVVASLAATTVFFTPVRLLGVNAASDLLEMATWMGAVAVATIFVMGTAWLLRRGPERARTAIAGLSMAAVLAGAGLMIPAL